MNQFTASNGLPVTYLENGDQVGVTTKSGGIEYKEWFGGKTTQALREFFRAEEDERRGRWRWPANPEYVVYLAGDGQAVVLHEPTAQTVRRYRGEAEDLRRELKREVGPASTAAEAYFDAHPEPKPAWHDAKPGEVWEVKADAGTFNAWRLESGAFMFDDESFLFADQITSGRRIWPES